MRRTQQAVIAILTVLVIAAAVSGGEPQTRMEPVRSRPAMVSQRDLATAPAQYRTLTRWVAVSDLSAPGSPVGLKEQIGQHAERRRALSRNPNGRFWYMAPDGPWQEAAARVSTPDAGGSGTLVGTTGNVTLMVTNHHVVASEQGVHSTVTAITRDGTRLKCRYAKATKREDVAVYYCNRSDLPTVPISSEDAPPGAVIETMGFGGPWHDKSAFRPFVALTVPTERALAVDAPAISGDSGSGMIWRGVLVGVNWGADAMPTQSAGVSGGEAVPLVYPATSSASATFLNRFLTQACGPLGCDPQVQPPGTGGYGGGGGQQFPGPEQFYRDGGGQQPRPPPPGKPQGGLTPPQNQPQQPQQPQGGGYTPPQQPAESCDCDMDAAIAAIKQIKLDCPEVDEDALADAVADKLKSDPGTPAPQGPTEPSGPDGRPGTDATVGLDELADAVADRLKSRCLPLCDEDLERVAQMAAKTIGPHPNRRVLWVDGDKKGTNELIIDAEEYAPGEPIVLDIQNILRERAKGGE